MSGAAVKHPINPSLQKQGGVGVVCFFAGYNRIATNDPNGQLQSYTSPENRQYDYGYDAAGRLDAVNLGPDGLVDLGDYLWDKPRSIRYSTTTFTHDANGHRTQKTGTDNWTYEYNAQERLTRITKNNIEQATYKYNAQGQRVQKTTNTGTTFYLYNSMGLAAEYDQTGTLQKEYGYLPDQPYMTNPVFLRTSTSFAYYQNDHLGTPQRLVDKQGITVWQASYDAFGKASISINTIENNLRFVGQYYDSESGLHQNWFRDYDPKTGRYIERDPVGLRGGINTYAYTLGNPISNTDPTGLLCFNVDNFANQVEQNRASNALTLGSLIADLGVGTMPKTPSELRGFGVPKTQLNPYTSQLSRWSGRFGTRALRVAGRTTKGIVAGTVATGAVILEGFYDWGVIGKAAWDATSSDDCRCEK